MSIPVSPAADGPWWTQAPPDRPAGKPPAEAVAAPLDAVDEATPAQVAEAVKEANASLHSRAVGLRFEMDEDTDKLIVRVVDRESGELIRQIPSEEVVRIAKVLGKAPGLLVSREA